MILLLLFPLSMPTSQEKQATASKWLKKGRLMQRRLPQIEHILQMNALRYVTKAVAEIGRSNW